MTHYRIRHSLRVLSILTDAGTAHKKNPAADYTCGGVLGREATSCVARNVKPTND